MGGDGGGLAPLSSKKSWARTPPPGVKGANATYAGRICALDIFGFECFERNGFEQLCINYTNEALQQLFTKVVFDEQQAEYEREGLVWTRLPYDDNAKVLSLLDGPQGVLPLLDEQCYLGERGSDAGFARSVSARHGKHDCLSTPRIQSEAGEFAIRHYAGEVKYSADGFLERNLDTLSAQLGGLLASSAEPLLRALFRDARDGTTPLATPRRRASTQAAGFKTQLGALMKRIGATKCHFVRCVNPNRSKLPEAYEPAQVAAQLRCSGVLHAVRLAREGFAVRLELPTLYRVYWPLVPKEERKAAAAAALGGAGAAH